MADCAVVALSGGMDSGVAAAIATQDYDCALLHVRYGQRTERREMKAFCDLADHYGVSRDRRLVVAAPYFRRFGGSSLTDEGIAVTRHAIERGGVPSSYVPFRNSFILSVAVAWAEVLNATRVFTGITEPDSSGYPDCRPAFVEAFNRLILEGTRPETRITVEAPLISMTKAGIVMKGIALSVPFHLTWSCYVNSGTEACGCCESCLVRLKGFREAGEKDPVRYKNQP